ALHPLSRHRAGIDIDAAASLATTQLLRDQAIEHLGDGRVHQIVGYADPIVHLARGRLTELPHGLEHCALEVPSRECLLPWNVSSEHSRSVRPLPGQGKSIARRLRTFHLAPLAELRRAS